jgi:hypothetical protein
LDTFASIVISEAEKLPVERWTELGGRRYGTAKRDAQKLPTGNAPRKSTIEKSNYTKKIAALINEGWELKKKQLDKLASQFKRKDHDFYLKYQSAGHLIYTRRHRNGNDVITEVESQVAEG